MGESKLTLSISWVTRIYSGLYYLYSFILMSKGKFFHSQIQTHLQTLYGNKQNKKIPYQGYLKRKLILYLAYYKLTSYFSQLHASVNMSLELHHRHQNYPSSRSNANPSTCLHLLVSCPQLIGSTSILQSLHTNFSISPTLLTKSLLERLWQNKSSSTWLLMAIQNGRIFLMKTFGKILKICLAYTIWVILSNYSHFYDMY